MEEGDSAFTSSEEERPKKGLLKYLVIGTIILILIIIALFFFLSKKDNVSNPVSCEKIEKSSDRDYCYVNLASKEKDGSICEKIENPGIKNYICYNSVAQATGNLSLCGIIQDSIIGGSDSADTCLYNLFLRSGNAEACDNIQDEDIKLLCGAIAEKNPSLCPAEDSGCLFDVATRIGDVNACQNIQGVETKERCIFYAKHTPDLCLTLNESEQALCFNEYASIMMDSSICDNIKDGTKDVFGGDLKWQCVALSS